MKNFDPTKPVQTRDGRKATVLRTNLKDRQPIVAIVADAGAFGETVQQYSSNGSFTGACPSAWDLVNVPEKIEATLWLVFFNDGRPLTYKERPTLGDFPRALAIKQFTLSAELGEGLSDEPEDDF